MLVLEVLHLQLLELSYLVELELPLEDQNL